MPYPPERMAAGAIYIKFDLTTVNTPLQRFLVKSSFDNQDDFVNNFEVKIPRYFNFAYDVVEYWAKEKPEAPALFWTDGHHDRRFSFHDISFLSDKVAAAFSRLGITRRHTVLLMLGRRYEWWICMIALHKIGVLAVPCSHQLSSENIAHRAKQTQASAIIVIDDAQVIQNIENARTGCLLIKTGNKYKAGWHSLADILNTSDHMRLSCEVRHNEDTIAFFTSGTSGEPKFIRHNNLYPLSHIPTAYWLDLSFGTRHYVVSDTGWGKAAWSKLYAPWLVGAEVFEYDYTNLVVEDLIETISKHDIASICAPPVVYNMILFEGIDRDKLPSLRHCSGAGEHLTPELSQAWTEHTGLKLYEGYGQTETALIAATFPFIQERPGAIGCGSPLYDMLILDDAGQKCHPGKIGRIFIRPKYSRIGICQDHDPAYDGYYDTYDKGYIDESGYLHFVSRADDVIKTSGYRISAQEVMNLCLSHPYVRDCMITSVADNIRGHIIKATIVLANEARSLPAGQVTREIKAHIKSRAPHYYCPHIVEYADSISRNTSGKVTHKTDAGS